LKDGPTIVESYRDDKDKIYFTGTHRISAHVIDAPTVRVLLYPNTFIGNMLCTIFNEQNKNGDTVARVYPR